MLAWRNCIDIDRYGWYHIFKSNLHHKCTDVESLASPNSASESSLRPPVDTQQHYTAQLMIAGDYDGLSKSQSTPFAASTPT